MPWMASRAEARIREHLVRTPHVDAGVSLAKTARLSEIAMDAAAAAKFPLGRATLVEGAHLYGVLLDFDGLVIQDKRETEASHARVLGYLDVHYRVWDALVDGSDAIRVDYHGPRLHAVVTEPSGDPAEQIRQAIALAAKLNTAAQRIAAIHGLPSRVRFGIDQGPCLAMTTGRALERDVLFLGSPANHAAKLAARERQQGIFLTENAERKLGVESKGGDIRGLGNFVASAAQQYRFGHFEMAVDQLAQRPAPMPHFRFHRATPPLATLRFEDLSPANSVRMDLASLFADIDGFTRYVDTAIRDGEKSIRTAVRDIHV